MKSLFLAVSAAVLFSSAAMAGDIVRQKSVTFADLNLGSKDGVVALHDRLLVAANDVCVDTKETIQAPRFEECREKAVQQAVAEIGKQFANRISTAQ